MRNIREKKMINGILAPMNADIGCLGVDPTTVLKQ
jgi:hypothetical protein